VTISLSALAQIDPDPSQRYVVAGAIALAVWPVLCFAAISTYKWLFWPDLLEAWPLRRRIALAAVTMVAGALAIFGRAMDSIRSVDKVDHFARRVEYNLRASPLAFVRTVVELLCVGLLVGLTMALAVKLFEKWVNNRLTDAERAGGAVGVRAWLAPSNLIVAVALALCAWMGLDYSFWFVLLMMLAALLAYPLLTMVNEPAPAPPALTDTISPERERVMRLLEQGKITAEESAELLGALAATLPPPPPPLQSEPWTSSRKLMLAGAAAVLVGFFLPWYSINPAQEVRRMGEAMNQQMRQMMQNDMSMSPIPDTGILKVTSSDGSVIRLAGGDVPNGLGWLVLFLGIGAAALPYVATGLRRESRWKGMLLMLCVGVLIALYLTTAQPRQLSVGLPVVLAGYVVELVAVWRERERRGNATDFAQPAPAL
jgi:hypothetical protein